MARNGIEYDARPLIPAPDREEFERVVQDILRPINMSEHARLIQRDQSQVSRAFNPYEPDRHNPFFELVLHLWAIDAKSLTVGDKLVNLILTSREMWQGGETVAEHPATLTTNIGKELVEAIDKEMRDADIDDVIHEYTDARNAIQIKINALIAKRAVAKYGRSSNVEAIRIAS